jgi:hypothetical protein
MRQNDQRDKALTERGAICSFARLPWMFLPDNPFSSPAAASTRSIRSGKYPNG